mmetsp:Transcript_61077/g.162368  ORF Transcript_61077/g.162368 Transcript_61077/m.162368 type:complete len:363 (+) Transcript_61077:51-1139(+)
MSSKGAPAELLVQTHTSDSESSCSSTPQLAAEEEKTLQLPPLKSLIKLTTAAWFVLGWMLFVGKDRLTGASDAGGVTAVLYWQAQIITTVGYGDLCPASNDRRLMVAFYVLVGNVIAGVGVMDYLTSMLAQGAEETKKGMLSKALAKSVAATGGGSAAPPQEAPAKARAMRGPPPLVKALVGFLAMILVGTVFFSFADYCICDDFDACDVILPFGETQGCLDLGGTPRSVTQAFYMSVITLTTVGFGDDVPGNWVGRLFATVWMMVGVASMGYYLGQIAKAVTSNYVKSSVSTGMSEETFRMIDADNSGALSTYEYVVYMLLNFNMVDANDVQELVDGFNEMDQNQSGTLEYTEVMGTTCKS